MTTKTKIQALIDADYQRKIKMFEAMKPDKKIILLGDSMVAYLNLSKFGLDDKVIHQGIAGDTTLGVMKRIDLVTRLNPEKVMLSIGSNDLVLANLEPEEIAKNILNIKYEIEQRTGATVYVFSMTPVLRDHQISNMAYIDLRTNHILDRINHLLRLSLNQSSFFNVFDDLLDDQFNLNQALTTDGIHLNDKGYLLYTKYIKSIL